MDGVNLLLMFSGQPIAKQFRHWLKGVAKEIQTRGAYLDQKALNLLERVNDRMITHDHVLESLCRRLETLEQPSTSESALVYYTKTAEAIDAEYATPTQIAHEIYKTLPKGFNKRGDFDKMCAKEYHEQFGQWPAILKPPLL